MSQLDIILKELEIKGVISDPAFPEPFMNEVKGERCMVFQALQQMPSCHCPHCQEPGIGYGWRISYVRMLPAFGYSCYIRLKKQRYRCSSCSRTYFSASNLTDKGCYLSNVLKLELVKDSLTKISVKDIAVRYHVSWPTVQRQISNWAQLVPHDFSSLPRVMSLDEFRAVSTLKNAPLALSIVDGHNHQIIDICPDRKQDFLKKHFGQYSEAVRGRVEYITTDMYEPYMGLARDLFPEAMICVDKFHVVQALSRALNSCRVEVMKSLTNPMIYKTFKKFWRIPMISSQRLDPWKTLWVSHFRTWKTKGYLLDVILSQNEGLSNTWEFYQRLVSIFERNDAEAFRAFIGVKPQGIHPLMKKCYRTMRKYTEYIVNALESGYSNGAMEANNNNIKVLKRIAYGYRNYDNFRTRILLVYGGKIKFAA